MQDDLEGLGISSHDNELGNAAVEGLGGFVGTLAELLVVAGLLDQVQDGVGEGGVGERGGFFVALDKKSPYNHHNLGSATSSSHL